MSDYLDRAKRYHYAIKQILLEEWDPIGVKDFPEAQDEYDSYVSDVYHRLIHRVPKHELFDYLWEVENTHLGLYGNRSRTETVVEKLVALNEKLASL